MPANPSNLVDTHAHVTKALGGPDAYRSRCLEAGLAWVLDAGIHPSDFIDRKAALSGEGFGDFFKLGVALAPHESDKATDADLDHVERLMDDPAVVAVSEIGLEYAHLKDNHPRQRHLFAAQLEMAKVRGLPVFLHIRDAWADAVEVVKASGVRKGAVHCFSAGPAEARAFLDLGFHLSFSGILTFKNARPTQDAAKAIPPDRLLTETDAPWLAPAPHRGQTNHSAYLPHTNAFLANLRGWSLEETHRTLRENAERLLQKD